jgi:hypothetical protein
VPLLLKHGAPCAAAVLQQLKGSTMCDIVVRMQHVVLLCCLGATQDVGGAGSGYGALRCSQLAHGYRGCVAASWLVVRGVQVAQ